MTPHHDHLDDDLRPLNASLDELGARERDRAPAGLEDRLMARTMPVLRAEGHADTPDPDASPVIARIGFGRAMRLAAAIAVLVAGVVGAILLTGPSGPTGGVAKVPIDVLIEEIDSEAADWFSDLDSLQTTADAASSASTDFWSLPDDDMFDSLLGEENS